MEEEERDEVEFNKVLIDGGIRNERILVTVVNEETEDAFCTFNGCSSCANELEDGQVLYVWGKPMSTHADSKMCVLQTYCSEDCVWADLDRWADKTKCDDIYATFYHL